MQEKESSHFVLKHGDTYLKLLFYKYSRCDEAIIYIQSLLIVYLC